MRRQLRHASLLASALLMMAPAIASGEGTQQVGAN